MKKSKESLLKILKIENLNTCNYEEALKYYIANRYNLNELLETIGSTIGSRSVLKGNVLWLNNYEIREFYSINQNWKNSEIIEIFVKKSESCSKTLDLINFFKIYDEQILCGLKIGDLIILYKKDNDNDILKAIYKKISSEYSEYNQLHIKLSVFAELRNFFPNDEIRNEFLNKIIDELNYNNVKLVNQNLIPSEWEYVYNKVLEGKTVEHLNVLCQVIYDDLLTINQRKKHIDNLISHNYRICIYKLILSNKLTKEEQEKCENEILKEKDQYYFYYLVHKKTEYLLKVFGSYLAILIYIKESELFLNKENDGMIREEVLSFLNDLSQSEVDLITNTIWVDDSSFASSIENESKKAYKVKPKHVKSKNN